MLAILSNFNINHHERQICTLFSDSKRLQQPLMTTRSNIRVHFNALDCWKVKLDHFYSAVSKLDVLHKNVQDLSLDFRVLSFDKLWCIQFASTFLQTKLTFLLPHKWLENKFVMDRFYDSPNLIRFKLFIFDFQTNDFGFRLDFPFFQSIKLQLQKSRFICTRNSFVLCWSKFEEKKKK